MHSTGKLGACVCICVQLIPFHYRFILVDIGDAGRQSDGGILANSAFGEALEAGALYIPPPSPIGTSTNFPYV